MDKDAMRCSFESCTYAATDEWSGTKEELLFILEEHVRKVHPIPTVELVDGSMTRVAWDITRNWGRERREELSVHMHW